MWFAENCSAIIAGLDSDITHPENIRYVVRWVAFGGHLRTRL